MINRWRYWKAADVIKRLPEHYRIYLHELKFRPPKPVHYIPENKEYIQNPETGEIKRIEDRPLPLIFTPECNDGLWGGEGVIKGFTKPNPYKRRVPNWWFPNLQKASIYSEILDTVLVITVSDHALKLIDEAHGLDFYILKTHPVDLRSQLAMDLKRKLLLTLIRKEMYPNDKEKQEKIYKKYQQFIIPEEEAEWVGLSLEEAIKKQLSIEEERNKPVPLKHKYRQELFQILKEMKQISDSREETESLKIDSSWITRLNPFGSKTKTS